MELILTDMRTRMPWNVAGRILKSVGGDPGRGWDKTIEKFTGRDKDASLEDRLKAAIEDYNLCGDKFVKIYGIEPESKRRVQVALASTLPEESSFIQHYPLGVPVEELVRGDGIPKVVAVVKNGDGVGVVLSHVVQMTKREKLEVSDLPPEAQKFALQYDEVIGLKNQNVQLFSVIWSSHDRDTIKIRTDLPLGMPMDLAHAVQSQVKGRFSQLTEIELGSPSDLYELLERIYEDDKEGTVVELSFATTSASVKNERMRRAGEDLRKEPYHLGGKARIGTPIEPFRLSVRWYLTWDGVNATPELSLIGTGRARSVAGDNRGVPISGAVISNCGTLAEYEYVIARMRHHMGRNLNDDSAIRDDEDALVE